MRIARSHTALAALLLAAAAFAQAPETTGPTTPAAQQPARPAAPPRPDTPRGAWTRFLEAARSGQYGRAAEYLNLRQMPRAIRTQAGGELARELETVLDRALWVDPEKLSDQPEGEADDGLPPLRDSLGTIETRSGPVEVLMERVSQGGGAPVWKIAAGTVAAVPALYEEFGWGPLARVLPAPFFEIRFLEIRLWQWIGLVLLVAVCWLVSGLFRRVVVRVTKWLLHWRGASMDGSLAEHVAAPLRLGIAIALFATGLPFLGLSLPVYRFFVGAQSAAAIVAFTWLVLRVLDMLTARVELRLVAHRHERAVATVPLFRRTLKVFVAVIAAIAALQNFGFNVTGLLAGLGVGGLAVALAAQKTVENLFGSVSLVADQPVRVGDVCRFGETVGTVEDIGLRSTRIRTIDRTLVTVPNAQFSTLPLENLSRRDRMPVRATLALPAGSSGDQVRAVLAGLREAIGAEGKVDPSTVRARFVRLGADKLEIEVFAYVRTSRWDEFVEIREQIFLRALDVVGTRGVRIN